MSIQTGGDGDVRTVDVAVCAQTPVGMLLPAVNDVAQLWPPARGTHGWRLDRTVGGPLDDSMSLDANGVRDGELLVLTAVHTPIPRSTFWAPARTVASAGSPPRECDGELRAAVCMWAVVVAGAALAWSGVTTHAAGHLIVAACGAFAVCWAALLGRSPTLSVAGAALTAAAGFLAVPSGPAAPNVLLAASAASAVAVVMTRLTGGASAVLSATASCSALVAATAAAATFAVLPVATIGAALATGALGLLALAPRVAILLSGLSTRGDAATRAGDGHATLTGLVAGSVGAVVVGTVLVALGCLRTELPPVTGAAFTGVAGLVTLLRSRTHADTVRRITLTFGGLLGTTAAFAIVTVVVPQYAYWFAAAVCALGLGVLRQRRLTATNSRAVDLIDYAALAAVVPLACWVIGVYTLARDLHLA
ncbi:MULTISPECIES: type VII secretion integral membrane protein EccD [unclassified Mycobacterium]|uniref:type VII secretion integral membrane protein EccD n=1 Tax=unclassified Mycobacterium TaxID=2642494 RepID=UPI0029C91A44|nr:MULTISPECIES: type VII secretion integral membrane protein EccD [unclassified Mycobacterium]